MKKFILPLLLILTVGMLAAVESEPSEVVGYVKYDCLVGLNLVAMPMDDGLTLTSEVGAIYNATNENIDAINIWDPASQTWFFSTNYGGGFWDPDLPVAPGSILYFNTITPLTFYSIGAMPSTNAQYNIIPGLNTIMVPLNMNTLTLTSEVGASIGDGEYLDAINLWDAVSQTWTFSTNYGGGFWDPDLNVSIGTPLFVNSINSVTWPTGPRILKSLLPSKSK
jgi:hypothetical protein